MWFGTLLLVLFVVTGIFWLLDKFMFAPKRRAVAEAIRAQAAGGHADAVRAALQRPWWLEYTAGLFSVIALVFVLRSFVVEPFRIPSGSMLPNLYVGDFILVNKYTYGIRMPITNDVVVSMNHPKKGEVVVFQFPPDKTQSYIKRVVGEPGDVIRYENKVLTVNGQVYHQTPKTGEIPAAEYPTYPNTNQPILKLILSKAAEEGAVTHDILTIEQQPTINTSELKQFPFAANTAACTYLANSTGIECKVPQGQYFMMGDNRDNSTDSRYWGFVPEQNIIGKAYFVWMNFGHLSRIGNSIQ